jgi:hypothetical protein
VTVDPLLLALVVIFARIIGVTCIEVARHPRNPHHLAVRRRGVDLRPAPWGDR